MELGPDKNTPKEDKALKDELQYSCTPLSLLPPTALIRTVDCLYEIRFYFCLLCECGDTNHSTTDEASKCPSYKKVSTMVVAQPLAMVVFNHAISASACAASIFEVSLGC